ncbi:hypothetical protein L1049_012932 [Liquidambar formosana]|uniref:ALG11 mannosyltransferase N-terminal domain-containing protein n=1 Tax=Liquidambar formosana TaxID=63359 RepID=A0AAP0RJK4_LIQFO
MYEKHIPAISHSKQLERLSPRGPRLITARCSSILGLISLSSSGGDRCFLSDNLSQENILVFEISKFMAIGVLVWALLSSILALIVSFLSVVIKGRKNRKRAVGFFHPYTNDGGGGERVLWCAVKAFQEESPDLDCVVYTGDHDASRQSLMGRAIDRFGVKLLYPPKVVHLYKRKWIEETTYPHFTMIGQSLGSVYLSWEALCKFTPLYYFDTSGYAFTYPLARMFGCKVICYTHYPTISLDMVSRVRDRSSMYNNDALIAQSTWLSRCKVIYYVFFSWIYGIVGSCAHLAMVNSSWTQSHIGKLWKIPNRIKRVYPPCDTSGLQVLPLERPPKTAAIISVAQFRPEKAHTLQLEAFSVAIRKLDADLPRPKLQFVANNSASAKMDIILEEDGQQTGFLAQNVEEYADAILEVIRMPESERLKKAATARKRLQPKYQHASRSRIGPPVPKAIYFGSRRPIKDKGWGLCLSVANSDRVTTDTNDKARNSQFQTSSVDESGSQTPEASSGSRVSSDRKQDTLWSPDLQSTWKKSPLTAREKLRAARVLSRYTESKASKSEKGSTVLEALRESDRGKKRSGLPEAPTNLLDDSKRGMPKQGLTFDFPGGFDLFIVAFSFVFISTVMFATTSIVWKAGAIHFNEY